jgi:hypothetical protein
MIPLLDIDIVVYELEPRWLCHYDDLIIFRTMIKLQILAY